ncbi:MAG: hypothetical protein JOZ51_11865 [Chloroflexi bacterium]|nr:hypothetical protein [Chloroflexota bacterium]
MCKRRTIQAAAVPQSYEGETIRFDAQGDPERRSKPRHHCGGFPWWTLWLIWPLISVLKWSVPLLLGVVANLGQITLPLIPVLMIVVGLLLLRRR